MGILRELVNVEVLTIGLFIIYAIALLFLICYGLMQIHLVYHYLKSRKTARADLLSVDYSRSSDYPLVTIQLPVYNEKYVMERLIDAVASFKSPEDRLEIQVLDDSTDETV